MKNTSNKSYVALLLFMLYGWFLWGSVPAHAVAQRSATDTLSLYKYLNLAQKHTQSDKDSAIYYLNKALAYSAAPAHGNELHDIYVKFGKLFSKMGNYPIALDYYFKAVKVLDKNNSPEVKQTAFQSKYVELYTQIAYCLSMSDLDKSLIYFNKSLDVAEAIHRRDSTYPINRVRNHVSNDIGTVYMNKHLLDSAEHYYRKSQYYSSQDNNKEMNGRLFNNLGVIAGERGHWEESLSYFNKALSLQQELKDTMRLTYVYLNLGEYNYKLCDYKESIKFTDIALEYSRKMQNPLMEFKSLLLLTDIYAGKQDYKKAYTTLKESNAMRDSLSSADKVRSGIAVEMQYQFEKQEKNQQHLMDEQKQKSIIYLFLTALLAVLSFFFLLLYRNQRILNQKKQIEKNNLELKNENLNLKNLQLQQSLEYKKNEMNLHAQYLLKKNELISSTFHEISKTQQSNESLDMVLHDIKNSIEGSTWSELEVLLQSLHHDFYEKLCGKHPSLTSNEKRLCLLIRLNLSTKEISAIAMLQSKSVEIARSRLRSKLGLKREDNLMTYLQQF